MVGYGDEDEEAVIPGPSEARSPESRTTSENETDNPVVMDSGQALRAFRNDGSEDDS
jgi:hypothetical protein